jgi:hypothetical protein
MKIRIPILVQDPSFWESREAEENGLPPVEEVEFEYADFRDGPETDLVTISDSVKVVFGKRRGKIHGYLSNSQKDMYSELRRLLQANDRSKLMQLLGSREFILVSTFACVLRTISLFERSNALGRPIQWHFSPSPLICQPCLDNVDKDARYQRDHKRIFFGFSPDPTHPDRITYLSLSREAVAHETAHAIVDGINPHLYENGNPHAAALHESLADLTALFVAIKSKSLMEYVLGLSSGSLEGENAFSQFAENIGSLLYGGTEKALRSFFNNEKLEERISSHYRASTVLSGAVWDVIRKLHAPYRDRLAKTKKYMRFRNPQYSASGEPLADIARRIRSLLYRALDYLPGGEITLADYGRALILVDRIQFGQDTKVAQSLEESFRQRRIFRDRLAARVDDDPSLYPALPEEGWSLMIESKQVLKSFIESSRAWLGIPSSLGFDKLIIEVQPRIDPPLSTAKFVEVENLRRDPTAVLRILWNEEVDNISGGKFSKIAAKRSKLVGTTIIIDCRADQILGRMSNASPTPELYPDLATRMSRENSIKANNYETGLYLENCRIVNSSTALETDSINLSGQVRGDTILLTGQGLSLHEGEYPTILVTSQ